MIKNIQKEIKKQQTEFDEIDKQYRKILKRSQENKPKKSVKQMVKEYEENNIIQQPLEFQDKIEPKPRNKTTTKKPIPYPRTQITFRAKALKCSIETSLKIV